MPMIKPVSELRNYPDILKEVKVGSHNRGFVSEICGILIPKFAVFCFPYLRFTASIF